MPPAFKHIASRANPAYKALRQSAREAGRPGQPVWLEGVHLCEEYLARVGVPALAVFDAQALAADRPGLAALCAAVPAARVLVLESGLLAGVSDIAGAQGVGFLADPPQIRAASVGDCAVLDRIQDPGNVGSILRTCAAAGVGTVLLTAGSAAAWSGKVLRAAQGAHFALRIIEGVATEDVPAQVGVPLVVSTLAQADSLFAPGLTLPAPAAWCFGHEGQGVDPWLQARAALRISIPQTSSVESLNVAAAAAVCLFEQRRRRLAGT